MYRSIETFGMPGAMLTVVDGKRKWYWDCDTAPSGEYGALPFSASADARTGPIWLEKVGCTWSRYASGLTSMTLLKPGCAVGQW